mgnify:CR=1 FL=1
MAFKYNIVRMFEEEREEGKAEGKAEDILDLLGDVGTVPDALRETILGQKNLEILRRLLQLASSSRTIEEFEKHFMK